MIQRKKETKGNIHLVFTKFVFLFLFLLVLPVSSAAVQDSEELSVAFNTQFDLKRACAVNGFFCGSNVVCNISLIYPDGNILIDNKVMTSTSTYQNITISQAQNNQLGYVQVMQSCNNVTDADTDTFKIAITGDGNPPQDFPTQFTIIILGFLLIGAGMVNERLRLFKHGGAILILVMGVITLYPGYSFINWSTLMGKALGFIFIGLGFYFLIEDSFSRNIQAQSYNSLNEENMEKEEIRRVERGRQEFFDEADDPEDGRMHQ